MVIRPKRATAVDMKQTQFLETCSVNELYRDSARQKWVELVILRMYSPNDNRRVRKVELSFGLASRFSSVSSFRVAYLERIA